MSISESKNTESKECTGCKRTFDLRHFYKKGDRYDSLCKACKKESRNASYQRKKEQASRVEAAPSAVARESVNQSEIQSENLPQRPNRTHIEPSNDTVYETWEKKQGKPLTMREKIEIKLSLTEFFKLLISEAKLQKVGPYGI